MNILKLVSKFLTSKNQEWIVSLSEDHSNGLREIQLIKAKTKTSAMSAARKASFKFSGRKVQATARLAANH